MKQNAIRKVFMVWRPNFYGADNLSQLAQIPASPLISLVHPSKLPNNLLPLFVHK